MKAVKLVCLDLDDTLIDQNSWYKLNIALGLTNEEDQAMYDAYANGNLSYEEWMEKLAALYRERGFATKERVTATLSHYRFKEGARELVKYLKGKGYQLVLLSGSFDMVLESVADTLGITHRKANTSFRFDEHDMLQEVMSAGDELDNKLQYLKDFCVEKNPNTTCEIGAGVQWRWVELDECAAVGDGLSDLKLFQSIERGIALEDAPAAVKEAAWRVVPNLDAVNGLL